jgi:hypothetical protein
MYIGAFYSRLQYHVVLAAMDIIFTTNIAKQIIPPVAATLAINISVPQTQHIGLSRIIIRPSEKAILRVFENMKLFY